MNQIFDFVYRSLKWMAKITGATYEEVNVIIWFILLPAIFIALIDRIFKSNYLKIGFAFTVFLVCVLIPNFENFSKQLFQKSATFLHWFDYLGLNYTQASVVICVVFPLLIIAALLFFIKAKKK